MRLPARALALLAACLPGAAIASGPQLALPAFDHLQQLATSSVNISVGTGPLGLAAGVLGNAGAGDADLQQLIHGLKGVYVRSYEFAADDMYPIAEVDAVRAQLASGGWSPLTQVGSRRAGEQVDVYVCMTHDKVSGLALIASDHRRFAIVNVVGSIDPAQLARLAAHFGVAGLTR